MWLRLLGLLLLLFLAVELVVLAVKVCLGVNKYFWMDELDLAERYGAGSWVIITGASSGQGRRFAIEWAKRGFNLLLIGSLRTHSVIEEIRQAFPSINVRFVAKNFADAHKDGFFDDIEEAIHSIDSLGEVSVLVNSVGHRVGWKPFHDMPVEKIRDVVATGTLVQARLIHMMIPRLIERQQKGKFKSLIVSITAQCMHPNFGPGLMVGNEISVPYLTIYEPTNAWGYYQMQSVIAEYAGQLDLLNVTPGAVKTVNTQQALGSTIGAVDDVVFVQNIFRMMGNVQGETCAHWAHAASLFAVNLAPWLKPAILKQTGEKIAENYMRNLHSKSYDTSTSTSTTSFHTEPNKPIPNKSPPLPPTHKSLDEPESLWL